MTRSNPKIKGFTLIEVLVASAIILLIFSSTVFFFKRASYMADRSMEFTYSTLVVQAKMEEIRAMDFSEVSLITDEDFDGGKGALKVRPLSSDLLIISVSYIPNPGAPPITVSTMRSRF